MKKISEDFLHFLWKNQSLTGVTLVEENAANIEVLDPGEHNLDAGPDFFNAKIRIGKTIWAGNVEIHINASDWLKHKHHQDPAYDSVILHVVYFNDCVITRSNNLPVQTVNIKFPSLLWDKYLKLMQESNWIPCENGLQEINPIHQAQWISRLLVEKLNGKYINLQSSFAEVSSQWDALLNREIFRCFGIPVNSIPFEMLATLIPFTSLLRLKDDQHQLEALLFGASGMLDNLIPNDIYMEGLKKEFVRHKGKLSATMMPEQMWKFMRMRPSSFPTIRIAQLASFIHSNYPLAEKLKNMPSKKDLYQLFHIRASDYWNTHYLFGKNSPLMIKYTGQDFFNRILINGLVPYLFFYGKTTNEPQFCEYAISMLEQIPAEKNKILKNWSIFGMKANNAFESQALLFLYKNYCKQKQCLNCQFGNYLIINGKTR